MTHVHSRSAHQKDDLQAVADRASAWTEALEGSNAIPSESPSHLPAGFLNYWREVILPDIRWLVREVEAWRVTEAVRSHPDFERQAAEFKALMWQTPCAVCGSEEHSAKEGEHIAY